MPTRSVNHAHFYPSAQWNDYPDDAGNRIVGYVVEYGGMAGDPALTVAVSTTLTVIDTTAPVVSSVSVPVSKTYVAGEILSFTVNLLLPIGTSNVIVRGLNLTNPGTTIVNGAYTNGGDALTVAGARNVFITHCSFFDVADHLLKITSGADNVTVSWSKFYYTSAQTIHRHSVLIGNPGAETAPIRVSLHHNLWGSGVSQNMPAVTYGHVHLYNNVFDTPGNTTGTEALDHSQLLSERNIYTGVANPLIRRHVNAALPIGRILAIGNTYTATTGTAPYAELDQVFTPPYSYEALPVSDVVTVVTASAGNSAGANTTDDTTGSAILTGPGAPVTPGTAFALSAVATGFTPATYQWRRNNVAIPGATFATYNVASAGETDAATYTIALTMQTGDTVVSSPLTVSLNAVPVTPPEMQLQVSGGGSPSAWFFGAFAILFGLRAATRRRMP